MQRSRVIGILRERCSPWERRAPFSPSHVAMLIKQHGVQVIIEPSDQRCFPDAMYREAGATVSDDLSPASAIFGVKTVPNDVLERLERRTFAFFSHTVKGQAQGMPTLDTCLARGIRLLDYECIRQNGNSAAPRLVAFGEFAGKAGMINALHGLGLRMAALGQPSPLTAIGQARSYADYAQAVEALEQVGHRIAKEGFPAPLSPLVVVIAGRGNVGKGAMNTIASVGEKVLRVVDAADLPAVTAEAETDPEAARRRVNVCVLGPEHMYRRRSMPPDAPYAAFDRTHFDAHPRCYTSRFAELLPHVSCLVTAFYWSQRFPRYVLGDDLRDPASKLLAIADLTCDLDGAVEPLVRISSIDAPFYVYDVHTGMERKEGGLGGPGILVMGVDILPAELPREATEHFGGVLLKYAAAIADDDVAARVWPDQLDTTAIGGSPGLPREIWSAIMTCHGALTPRYQYINAIRSARARERRQWESAVRAGGGATRAEEPVLLRMQGHLFDAGLINSALDIFEAADVRYDLREVSAGKSVDVPSSAILALSASLPGAKGHDTIQAAIANLRTLARTRRSAECTVTVLTAPLEYGHGPGRPRAGDPSTPLPASWAVSANDHVVVLGAGLCARPAVEYLSRNDNVLVHVVSSIAGEAAALCANVSRTNCRAHTLNADLGAGMHATGDHAELQALIRGAGCVVSLLPAHMHAKVAEVCVDEHTPLVTASYVDDAMRAVHDRAVRAGVPILCELGLDPGIDHMSAMQLIRKVKARGGRVVSFRSVCGGLPAPEIAVGPIPYKFSWSPAGALAAAEKDARFLEDGIVRTVDGPALLGAAQPLAHGPLAQVFSLEVLPNRDALAYLENYGISHDATTCFRGTLRFSGWSALMRDFQTLGLLAHTPVPSTASWASLMDALHRRRESGLLREPQRVREALQWLGALDEATAVEGATVREAFCTLLQHKLAYQPGERDMVVMQHTVVADFGPEGCEHVAASLILHGGPVGPSAMAKAVGCSAAIGAELLRSPTGPLRGSGGVHLPTDVRVADHALAALRNEGIHFTEQTHLVQHGVSATKDGARTHALAHGRAAAQDSFGSGG